jgi:hypothetical protein
LQGKKTTLRRSKYISPDSRIENLLEMVIANQKTMLEEFNLIHRRMDRLEAGGVLPHLERISIETFFTSKEVTKISQFAHYSHCARRGRLIIRRWAKKISDLPAKIFRLLKGNKR